MSSATIGSFESRHIGPRPSDCAAMVETIGVPSLDVLIDEALPQAIRLPHPPASPLPETEHHLLGRLRSLAAKNEPFRSFIGLGYYGCVTPPVILRNVLENPGWYTPYTPYQAEIAQGRLEALLTFQTMVEDLTGMPIANASLLDEPTAAGEAMTMLRRAHPAGSRRSVFLVADSCYPQTLDVLRGRSEPLGITLRVAPLADMTFGDDVYGVLVQTPDTNGAMVDLRSLIERAHAAGVLVAVATDLLSLALTVPPGEIGADVVLGSAQRFGVPMGAGGPHAAFFAVRESAVRQAPGRIIGVSVDRHGNRAYRMAIQTREQHIRREKATSNICTAQALLATMAGMFGVYHGAEGLAAIASGVHAHAAALAKDLAALGCQPVNEVYFDTLRLRLPSGTRDAVRAALLEARINVRYGDGDEIGIACDETMEEADRAAIVAAIAQATGRAAPANVTPVACGTPAWPASFVRTSPFLTHPVFRAYRSETAMMRYLRSLERKDVGLDTSMIPLGSCTMKLNAAAVMEAITWPEFTSVHPFAPDTQAAGYLEVYAGLQKALCEVTGFAAVSLQPNSGAQGELAGLMVIRAYHHANGQAGRHVVLIPSSAHGTNPASAVMAGMRVVVVACDARGNVDVADLKAKASQHADTLAALMITYPSTHGVFEDAITEICAVIHAYGGQVYMDGANLNAQVGLTSPAFIGADVCHMNLHKTFAIPHGGGGPGMGPIAVAAHLAPYLPGHAFANVGGALAIPAVAGSPRGSANILLISYAYVSMLGARGMTEATKYAILNANYIKSRLEAYYPVLYTNAKGRVAHEMIFDLRGFKAHGIEEGDVAKRLMDYGFHAPTVSFPVPGTLMVEPTESEPKEELDRFCDAMIAIRAEIQAVMDGQADPADNVLKNSPHTVGEATAETWSHPYTREQAVYPLPWVRASKFWPSVGRIDNPYGDRNLFCSCPPWVGLV
jgi:glycine dehydrogenase